MSRQSYGVPSASRPTRTEVGFLGPALSKKYSNQKSQSYVTDLTEERGADCGPSAGAAGGKRPERVSGLLGPFAVCTRHCVHHNNTYSTVHSTVVYHSSTRYNVRTRTAVNHIVRRDGRRSITTVNDIRKLYGRHGPRPGSGCNSITTP
jgi:hypothetical protein